MKPAEKVLRSWIRSLPAEVRNANIFNADRVLTRDMLSIRIGSIIGIANNQNVNLFLREPFA